MANSTAEAEYRAAVSCIDDLSWIRIIGSELGLDEMKKPTAYWKDSGLEECEQF